MDVRRLLPFHAVLALAAVACSRKEPPRVAGPPAAPDAAVANLSAPAEAADASADATLADAGAPAPPAKPAQIDPDGNDDPEDPGPGTIPARGRFVRVGKAPLAWQRVCDLTAHEGGLFAAHANQPLGTDGATITRYDPADPKKPFTVAFDWNRFGEPSKGGGAGQGFLRVRRLGGRLFVADADPPYNGLGLVEYGTEGYVFVSDPHGAFAPPRAPHYRPPGPPDAAGKAGAGVVPRAYHVIDVARFRGRLYTSTGSVPPKERAWYGPSPGALHVASEDLSRWTYETDYPFPYKDGVWRLTFMVRFKDRLYAGIQDYDGREPYDYVVFAPPEDAKVIRREDAKPARVTDGGAARTLRWTAIDGKLYWIAYAAGEVRLRVTTDGDTWDAIDLPAGAGRPTDVRRFRDGIVILTENRLYRLKGREVVELAAVTDKKTPFVFDDVFCAAPLGVLGGELYAGGQRDGALYRIDWD